MLDPNSRALLLESLRPPEGGKLDVAVGTTFSLDLLALLTAPLAFTWFSWEDAEGRPSADPNALLEAIRRHADHIHIFCQAGLIKVPPAGRQLFAWLEPCVHEVVPPNPNGVFHPKVWALRYRMPDDSYRIRVLCLSRNLTFDRSWDTLLTLDGELQKKPQPGNEPLVAFINKLPQLTLHPADKTLGAVVASLADDIAHTQFELPEGFQSLRFWPLGIDAEIGQRNWPFPKQADQLLAMSPFLTPGHLAQLAKITEQRTLVSRVDSLAALSVEQLEGYQCYAMTDDADLDVNEASAADDMSAEAADTTDESLSGLHAKLLVADVGDTAHVYTGSANATSAAFNSNVEFVVELTGPVRDFGVARMLQHGGKGVVSFADLLDEFTPGEPIEPDAAQVNEQRLLQLRNALVQGRPQGTVTTDAAAARDTELYALRLNWHEPVEFNLQTDETIDAWPINLGSGYARPIDTSISNGNTVFADWSNLSFPALSRFFAFRIAIGKGSSKAATAFVMNLPLAGLPERVLASLFADKSQVLRFLLLLLAGEGVISVGAEGSFSGPGMPAMGSDGRFQANLPMLESLLKALDTDPDKLDQLATFLEQLKQSEAGQALLPDDFEQIWAPLWAARQQLKGPGA